MQHTQLIWLIKWNGCNNNKKWLQTISINDYQMVNRVVNELSPTLRGKRKYKKEENNIKFMPNKDEIETEGRQTNTKNMKRNISRCKMQDNWRWDLFIWAVFLVSCLNHPFGNFIKYSSKKIHQKKNHHQSTPCNSFSSIYKFSSMHSFTCVLSHCFSIFSVYLQFRHFL